MKSWAFGVSVLAIVAVAAWSYHVNYETKTVQARVAALEAEIAATEEAIAVLEVNWQWLNNPVRLTALVERHPELGLAPRRPEAWARRADLPFPRPDVPEPASVSAGIDETLAGMAALDGEPALPPMPQPRPFHLSGSFE